MTESRLVGLGVAVLGLFALFILIPFGIASPSSVGSLALAPEFWPIIIASVFTLMGVILAIRPSKIQGHEESVGVGVLASLDRLVVMMGALFAVYYLVPFLGMVVPTALVIFGLSWLAGERRMKLLLMLALGIPILLALFFYFVAKVPIPMGAFDFVIHG